jgi:hypothetical protein
METVTPPKTADPAGDRAFLEEKLGKDQNKVISRLSDHVHAVFTRNAKDFKPIRREMIASLQRCRGEYPAAKLQDIKNFGGSEAFVRVGEAKARAAVGWIKEIYTVDSPFSFEPTPIPELPDETLQGTIAETRREAETIEIQLAQSGAVIDPEELASLVNDYYYERLDVARKELKKTAKERCSRAQQAVRDQNAEGGWDEAFKDFLYYFVRVHYSVIKGPVLTKKKKNVWAPGPEGGVEFTVKEELGNEVYCASPFNILPTKGSRTVNDGDIVEIHELTRQAISNLIGVPGYNDDKVRQVLAEYDAKKLKGKWFTLEDEEQVKEVEKEKRKSKISETGSIETKIRALEFYGTIAGSMLLEWAGDKAEELGLAEVQASSEYQVNCWKIGDHIIKAVINPDSLGRKPYHISSWAKNPAWLVGEGMIEFSAVVEDAINAVVRALLNNIGIASGPMVEEDKDRIPEDTPVYPWKKFRSTTHQMKNNIPAVNFYQPQMHAQELISVYTFLSRVLDEMTVPAYAQGASQSGVTTGTASVATQLFAMAARSIKAVVANIDDDIIVSYHKMAYDFTMKFSDDESVKGDANVIAKGVKRLQEKEEQAQRKVEYLQAVSNPVLMEILGAENMGALLAQIAKSNSIDLPDVGRLDGSTDVTARVQQMIMQMAGGDPNQEQGQIAKGGGAPTKPVGVNPDGSKAGVVNG